MATATMFAISAPAAVCQIRAAPCAKPAGAVSLRSSVVGRPLCLRKSHAVQKRAVRAMAAADPDVAKSIKDAEETCASGTTGECAAAWDEVEELSAAASDKKKKEKEIAKKDPLEKFCEDNPETDECRVYED
uniref:CP12 n=1 Tax=Mesostigma viride TaxID=41882 RepID=Q20FC7_MESVI|nr:CP12 [Mesostigma viride]